MHRRSYVSPEARKHRGGFERASSGCSMQRISSAVSIGISILAPSLVRSATTSVRELKVGRDA